MWSCQFASHFCLQVCMTYDKRNGDTCLIPRATGAGKDTRFFDKKLGSAPSTKSFLISHENFAIIVLKVY